MYSYSNTDNYFEGKYKDECKLCGYKVNGTGYELEGLILMELHIIRHMIEEKINWKI